MKQTKKGLDYTTKGQESLVGSRNNQKQNNINSIPYNYLKNFITVYFNNKNYCTFH